VLEAIIAGAVVLVLIAGFWWTRGYGGIPGGTDDPAREARAKAWLPGALEEEPEDREHEVE
jgi:hypothetical protein